MRYEYEITASKHGSAMAPVAYKGIAKAQSPREAILKAFHKEFGEPGVDDVAKSLAKWHGDEEGLRELLGTIAEKDDEFALDDGEWEFRAKVRTEER